ncbi:hypothetical protein CIG75_16515 [Tumebacillus algifaecis]|uniref:Methyl-accepting chemotaxis protein n=2 Tax=Tumebacillus algifaecis TaxID=1214604 RepID=A0A223D471_9BACL|nr:hypothetical protein CIG75_16515 [Tumebacillus algifaecis]
MIQLNCNSVCRSGGARMMRMKIRMKLLVSFSVVLLLLVAMGLTSMLQMNEIGTRVAHIDRDLMPGVIVLSELRAEVREANRLVLRVRLESNPSEQDRLRKDLTKVVSAINEHRISYEKLPATDEENSKFQAFAEKWQKYEQQIPKLIDPSISNEAWDATNAIAHQDFVQSSQLVSELVELNVAYARTTTSEAVAINESSRWYTIILSVAAILIGIAIGLVVSYRISSPVLRLAEQVKRVATGDLTVQPLQVSTKDEVADLADDVNLMTENLRTILQQVSLNSHQVAATSEQLTASAEQTGQVAGQIAESVQDVSLGAEKQLRGIHDSTQVVADISQSVTQIASSIQAVTDATFQATSKAADGQEVVERTVAQMQLIGNKASSTADVIDLLGQKSEEIEQIVSLITSIAGQTNLLALNAAIEAARAGEHGKGFAVVADEVRKLAEQSGDAADHISRLIKEVQEDTSRAISVMGEGTVAVEEGFRMIALTGTAFEQILSSVTTLSEQAQEVSAAVQQVNAGAQTMVGTMEGIAAVSEQAAANTQQVASAVEEQNASMEEISSASHQLSKMAGELQESLSSFKL